MGIHINSTNDELPYDAIFLTCMAMDRKTALTFSEFKRISTLLPIAAVVVTPRGNEGRAIRGTTLAKKKVVLCVIAMVRVGLLPLRGFEMIQKCNLERIL